MKKRTLKLVLAIGILFSILLIFFVYRHPIILKWMTGSARMVGLPVKATVFADGIIDQKIRVFHTDRYWSGEKADCYILYLLSPYPFKTKHIISLNLQNNYAGVPSATNKMAFDLVFGILFQSETGSTFSDFRDDMKGYGFDPHLKVSGGIIHFNLPSTQKQEGSFMRIQFSE